MKYVRQYCPHCWPNGLMFSSTANVDFVVEQRYCERYVELIEAQQERMRGRVMWQEQL